VTAETLVAKRPLRADAQRNRDRIVEVAKVAFGENGTQASLDDIACRAQVGPGTLYRHFPSRDSLLAAALDESRRDLDRLARELATADDSVEALRQWIFAVAAHLNTYGGLPDSVAQALKDNHSPLGLSCSLVDVGTEALLARARQEASIRADVDAHDLVSLAGSLAWIAESRNGSPDDLAKMLDIYFAGLR
jgi:AcrR family transcriptional regulator